RQPIVAQMRVDGCEEHALLYGDTGQDQVVCPEMLEQCRKRRREETRMFRFEDEVITFIRCELLDDGSPQRVFLSAALDQFRAIGAPTPTMIVDIDNWHTRCPCAPGQLRDWPRYAPCSARESAAAIELIIGDQIDDQQGRRVLVRGGAVERSGSGHSLKTAEANAQFRGTCRGALQSA